MPKEIKKFEGTEEEWTNLAYQLARSFAPRIYACKKCGYPVVDGYCCYECGDTNPSEMSD